MTQFALIGDRKDLRDDDQIIALMAQDLNDLRREGGGVTQPDLLHKGWSFRQIKEHYLHALEEAFRTYCETAPTDRICIQAKPFLDFDANMRKSIAAADTHFFETVERPGVSGSPRRTENTFTSYLRRTGLFPARRPAPDSDGAA